MSFLCHIHCALRFFIIWRVLCDLP
jgi:hypothetical protein